MGRVIRKGRIIPVEKVKILLEADTIIKNAHENADKIQAKAQEESLKLYENTREKALSEARQEAIGILFQANQKREQMLNNIQGDVITLAVDIAKKIIQKEIQTCPEIILDICKESLKHLIMAESIVIRAHPNDVPIIEERKHQFAPPGYESSAFQVIADSKISPGGCIMESEIGSIDARLETQLSVLEYALMAEDG